MQNKNVFNGYLKQSKEEMSGDFRYSVPADWTSDTESTGAVG